MGLREYLAAVAEVDGGQCHDQSQAGEALRLAAPLPRLPTTNLAR